MNDYLDAYRHGLKQFGTKFEVTLWASPRTQQLRFEVFAQMVDLRGKRILDAGCSRGDLAQWLLDQKIIYEHYTGIDGVKEVIDYARSRNLPRSEFIAGDILTQPALLREGQPDVICISGTLNTMTDAQAMQFLSDAWQATRSVLIFNFLSDTAGELAPPQEEIARRLDTLGLLAWAFTQTPNVTFRQDYFPHGHDATIRMKRERRRG